MLSFRAKLALVVLSAAAGAHAQYVVGQVSETLRPTRVYASPSTHCRSYYRVGAYQRLVTNPGPNGFVRVLLQNGAYGYMPESGTVQLPYKAVSKQAEALPNPSRSGEMIANYGLRFSGTRYKFGGTDVNTGIDCSAFVQKLFGDVAGIKLPRTAAEQEMVGAPVTRLENLQPGDRLYFWDKSRGKIGHTGVYIGGGRFVHSSHGNGGVATNALTASWLRILVAARRD